MAYGHNRGKRVAPFSLRLTFEERATIEANAGTMPVGAYIKSILLADDAPRYRARVKSPVKDTQALAELLACLGASRIANNLNQLAHAANLGNLYFDTDTKIQISQACSDVRIMRQLLMQALGMKLGEEPRPKQSTSQSFTRASTAKRFSL
jgi:hypothetical protein